jgi:hypothetical protein
MCNNFLQQIEIDALEQLISADVKVKRQIVRDGFRTCLMVFRIVTGVVARVVAGVIVDTFYLCILSLTFIGKKD